ncbi:hypothetical protein GCM10010168_51630 [Actinoplanes ianthinogenes]|uniref:Major facilitator superfamily (MFS) profile domain-containing protein n=2 Tax=Actinoplanes ianthinogenes TaxID=122358 RepID=A0ABM7M3K0_9ACTN|nr:hypothetical protein Aiant_68710 [Actinoplanes ianthinogenes]GGR27099.1 hypothetical protein GCM10010168_51630 [Actinoplanes ianthinogenes]
MRSWITVGALALSTFLYVTLENLPIGLLPQMAAGLGVSASAAGQLVTAYGLIVVVSTIPLTRVTHRFRRRRLLAFLLAIAVAGTLVSAFAPGYPLVLGGRVAVAMSQAVFWAVVTPAAASLVRPARRGRAMSILYGGSSAAPLLGVPAGIWLGQQTTWRIAFVALAALGLIALAVVAALMPDLPPGSSDADRGSDPDPARFRVLLVTVALLVTGAFTAFTYVSEFLTEVTGVDPAAVGPALFARGVAGLAGVLFAGWVAGRYAWPGVLTLIGVQAVALAGQYLFGDDTVMAIVAMSLAGAALSASTVLFAALILRLAPGRTDAASAGVSTAFNVGITAGAAASSALVGGTGAQGPVLVGAAVTVIALLAALAGTALTHRPRVPADSGRPHGLLSQVSESRVSRRMTSAARERNRNSTPAAGRRMASVRTEQDQNSTSIADGRAASATRERNQTSTPAADGRTASVNTERDQNSTSIADRRTASATRERNQTSTPAADGRTASANPERDQNSTPTADRLTASATTEQDQNSTPTADRLTASAATEREQSLTPVAGRRSGG